MNIDIEIGWHQKGIFLSLFFCFVNQLQTCGKNCHELNLFTLAMRRSEMRSKRWRTLECLGDFYYGPLLDGFELLALNEESDASVLSNWIKIFRYMSLFILYPYVSQLISSIHTKTKYFKFSRFVVSISRNISKSIVNQLHFCSQVLF